MNTFIESSPALALPLTPLPVASIAESLAGPQYFVKDLQDHVYSLESAPVQVFDAWTQEVIEAEQIDDPLMLWIVKGHMGHWDQLARYWFAINLALHGIDIAKYVYVSEEATWA